MCQGGRAGDPSTGQADRIVFTFVQEICSAATEEEDESTVGEKAMQNRTTGPMAVNLCYDIPCVVANCASLFP